MDASEWDERYRHTHESPEHLVWGVEPNRFVREQCERLPVGTAIDLACGEGRNALWLARLGWNVTGVDFSAVAIDRARTLTEAEPELVRVRLKWQVADITTLPLKPGGYDLVLMAYVHVGPSQHDALVRAAAGAVRSGGHLVIVGHDRRNIEEGVGGPQDPEVLEDPDQLRAALTGVEGLDIEMATTVPRPTADGVALDTLLRARRL